MGGNAIKMSRRHEVSEYTKKSDEVVSILTRLFPGHRVEVTAAYGAKTSFGDCDVLLVSDNIPGDWIEKVTAAFGSREVFKSKNSPVCSFEFKEMQVDVILMPSKHFDFSLKYFSWNDLGNFIGRTAHRAGFKFGHDGMWYVMRDGTYVYQTLLVTDDFDSALTFLGYDPDRYNRGFITMEEIFWFASSSVHFQPDSFALHNRRYRDRVRDSKRASYRAFLEWMDGRTFGPMCVRSKEEWLTAAYKAFPKFHANHINAIDDYRRAQELKKKFNGNLVRGWTGLEGKSLGKLMGKIRGSFLNDTTLTDFMLKYSADTIKEWVLQEKWKMDVEEGRC